MKFLDAALKSLTTAVFSALVVMTATAVFSRYALNFSLVWAEELGRYLFVWIVCIGAAIAVGRGAHVSVDFLVARLPPKVQTWIALIRDIGICVFLLIVIVYGTELTLFGVNSFSLAMGMPMALVYSALPFSAAVMLAFMVRGLGHQFWAWRRG